MSRREKVIGTSAIRRLVGQLRQEDWVEIVTRDAPDKLSVITRPMPPTGQPVQLLVSVVNVCEASVVCRAALRHDGQGSTMTMTKFSSHRGMLRACRTAVEEMQRFVLAPAARKVARP